VDAISHLTKTISARCLGPCSGGKSRELIDREEALKTAFPWFYFPKENFSFSKKIIIEFLLISKPQ